VGCISPPVYCRPTSRPDSKGPQVSGMPLVPLKDTRQLYRGTPPSITHLFRSQQRATADLFYEYSRNNKATRQTYRQALGKLRHPWIGEAALVVMRGMVPSVMIQLQPNLLFVNPRRRSGTAWQGIKVNTYTYAKLKHYSNLWRLTSEALGYYNQLVTLWRMTR